MADLKIGIAGCAGRMGQTLLRQVAATPGCVIAGGSEAPGSAAIGQDVAGLAGLPAAGIAVVDSADALFAACDAVLDFTVPAATAANARAAATHGKILIAGTTGMSAGDEAALRDAAQKTPIVYAANMSVGVNVLAQVVKQVATMLGPDAFDIEVVEMHHRNKVDAPSGTALLLGRAAAQGRGVTLDDVADRGRDGITGARQAGHIGFASLRGGSVPGDHTVIFASDSERLELTHRAQDRSLFAAGAVRAALWARGKPAGLYDMTDVLGLKD
ncbi:MAG: 4-hydroxy-tetrahydrodipicolinate reductase [Proteobacteria bacterium]|nr:4-hydroxy-tetrahydrodipicolinate reductase [Pseudomonadota bacterium]MDA1057786.1 4-hydroxy-tetrahydrodipicolinate reductase [Pseudomonadota bacterium]